MVQEILHETPFISAFFSFAHPIRLFELWGYLVTNGGTLNSIIISYIISLISVEKTHMFNSNLAFKCFPFLVSVLAINLRLVFSPYFSVCLSQGAQYKCCPLWKIAI